MYLQILILLNTKGYDKAVRHIFVTSHCESV